MGRGRKPKSALTVDVRFEQTLNMSDDANKSVGRVIKHYQKLANAEDFTHLHIEEYLDHGSSGVVLKCTSPLQNNQTCVIKLPWNTTQQSLSRVTQDMDIWKKFPMLMLNEYLVSPITHDTFLPEGLYRMPHWESSLLRFLQTSAGKISIEEIVKVTRALCQGCQALHSLSPPHMHRDIKPANILIKLDTSQKIKKAAVTDFGSVYSSQHETHDKGTTFGYRAPEMAWNFKTKGPATDLWAIATILLEMLLGQSLFSEGDQDEKRLMKAENILLFTLMVRTQDDIIQMLGQTQSQIGTVALSELLVKPETSSVWKTIEAKNAWDFELVLVLQKCFQLDASKRFASVSQFETAFTNLVLHTKRYAFNTATLQCPAQTCDWKTLHAQNHRLGHIHTWFIAILWTENPANSAFIHKWFSTNLITERAYRFQCIALKMWAGDPKWIDELAQALTANRPKTPEDFYTNHMKLPRPLVQDPVSNIWHIQDITHEKSTVKGNTRQKLYFDSTNNQADMQVGIISVENTKGNIKSIWCEIKPRAHQDLPVGQTFLGFFQRKTYIHHIPITSHAATAQSTASRQCAARQLPKNTSEKQ